MSQTSSTPIQHAIPTAPRSRVSHRAGFWIVAGAFLTAMAFSVVPSPLWSLYEVRDRFSTFAVTVAFAAYAVGVIVSLFLAGHLSDRLGRRRILIPAVLIEALAAVLFIFWNDLAGLVVDRIVSGVGIGMITATATAYISELHSHAHPSRGRGRADIVSTAANLGGFAVGALVSGVLAQYVSMPLVTPYLVFLVLLILAAIVLALLPETVVAAVEPARYRPQRIRVPRDARGAYFAAGAIAFGAFSLLGLFTALAPAFIAGDLGITSRAIAGLVVFVVFGSAALTQVLLRSLGLNTQIAVGVALMLLGLAGIVAGVFAGSFALFIVAGVLAGAGAGVLFKSALGVGAQLSEPRFRGETLAGLFLFGYIGLAVPVLGVGIVGMVVPLSSALLIFAIFTALVLLAAGTVVLRRKRA